MMQKLYPKPFKEICNISFDELTIRIRNKDFAGVPFKDGRIVVVFQFCFFRKLIIDNLEDIDFEKVSISFNNCYIKELEIENITSTNISIHFHASMLRGRILASNLTTVSLNNCLLEYGIFVTNVPRVDVSYTTENIFPYWWGRLFRERQINDHKVVLREKQHYHIENAKIIKITSSKKSTEPTGKYIKQFNTGVYRLGYRLTADEEKLLNVGIHIVYTKDSEDELTEIDNFGLRSLSLSGNPSGKFSVQNSNIGSLYLTEFSPKLDASFYNITPRPVYDEEGEETRISIHQCNLDNTWFDNVDFGDFQKLSFYRSKFSNSVFTSCSFPEKYEAYENFLPVENIHYPENRTSNHHKDQYEIFLQLKKALEGTGNVYESLKLQGISHTALNKVKSISPADKVILWINSKSNNHGLSIKKPFLWFLGFSSIFYISYLWSIGRIFQCTEFDPNLIGYYFSFVDITHRSDFLIEKNQLNGAALAIDYLHKLLIGFIIYQFIAAFRKYGKK
ncbi:hypothetical protein EZ428_19275 [Pedobacter frigiditerrae]|uniref:Uncharacterized protein n=1 Tax=Pedobacter frigiditerrae TaxID=2530452 RepID=A0A4R0MR74_9SPHI|nr:hypothetical protein [Pedobacter frigiditerrae]TCC88772.1 hypothetical protein EZ428_19275 [Pedobacter frigiditerrae]